MALIPIAPVPAAVKSAKTRKAKAKGKADPSPQRRYYATGFPGKNKPLPPKFVAAVHAVEKALGTPAWLLIQNVPTPPLQHRPYYTIDDYVLKSFLAFKALLVKGKPIPLIIDSPGGQAKAAYQIASFLRSHCGGFLAVVPEYAKSAATLLTLGAEEIILAPQAEIGPLDVQVFDPEREGFGSALDEVQALERLNAFALQAVDSAMYFFVSRTGKSMGTLLPQTLNFVSGMLRPLFEKIDTVHYTQMSRMLKVGEEYAIRLLQPRYGEKESEEIARKLVNGYPEHGFYIDRKEASKIGLKTSNPTDELTTALEGLAAEMQNLVVVGQLKEIKP